MSKIQIILETGQISVSPSEWIIKLKYYTSQFTDSSCVVSQLHMLSIPGSIPAAYTIFGTGGSVL